MVNFAANFAADFWLIFLKTTVATWKNWCQNWRQTRRQNWRCLNGVALRPCAVRPQSKRGRFQSKSRAEKSPCKPEKTCALCPGLRGWKVVGIAHPHSLHDGIQDVMQCLESWAVKELCTSPSSTQIERCGGPWTILGI